MNWVAHTSNGDDGRMGENSIEDAMKNPSRHAKFKFRPTNQKGKGNKRRLQSPRVRKTERTLNFYLHLTAHPAMSSEETGRRKSQRKATAAWKDGDTRALFRAPGHRTPKEIAASKKVVEKVKSKKQQDAKMKSEKTARGIRWAAQVEDAIAKESEEAEDAFPRRRSGELN